MLALTNREKAAIDASIRITPTVRQQEHPTYKALAFHHEKLLKAFRISRKNDKRFRGDLPDYIDDEDLISDAWAFLLDACWTKGINFDRPGCYNFAALRFMQFLRRRYKTTQATSSSTPPKHQPESRWTRIDFHDTERQFSKPEKSPEEQTVDQKTLADIVSVLQQAHQGRNYLNRIFLAAEPNDPAANPTTGNRNSVIAQGLAETLQEAGFETTKNTLANALRKHNNAKGMNREAKQKAKALQAARNACLKVAWR